MRARGATAYVTLEPCCHHGVSPPCTEALIAAGIARVVIAARDPDPRVDGGGIAQAARRRDRRRQGVLEAEGAEMAAGFFSRVQRGRPLVTLKLATTLDGRIATKSGESKWITGDLARRRAHALRGRHDAVLVGVGTVMADDPKLTCRIDGFKQVPMVRVIADSHLRTRATSAVVATARALPTWFLVRDGTDPARVDMMTDAGCRIIEVPSGSIGVDLGAALAALGTAGITRLLVEGGAQIAAALLRADLVDRLAWFHAPGRDGRRWLAGHTGIWFATHLANMPRFVHHESAVTGGSTWGEDMLTELRRAD